MVKLLLNYGVDCNFPCGVVAINGNEQILRLLLEAEVKLGNFARENHRSYLLSWAEKENEKNIVRVLLECGA
jgi:hypothetical protein